MGCERMASRTAGVVTILFVLSFVLLASGTHGSPPISAASKTAVAPVTQEKMADLKASAQSAKHAVHMLAEEKKEEEATTQKKADESDHTYTSLWGGVSLEIWKIREFFARCFGYALLAGICLLIVGCCVSQRGCFIYDKFIDKDPYYNRVGEAEAVASAGDKK